MPLPTPPNTTCDIYRFGHIPPTPDVANVPCYLAASYASHQQQGQGRQAANLRYTHVMLVDSATDVRDSMTKFVQAGAPDTVFIPQGLGTATTSFVVRFVERHNQGLATDHLRVYLDRAQPPWPTNNI